MVVGALAATTFGLALLTGGYVLAARRQPVRIGVQAMQGMRVEILDWSGEAGHVLAEGERWQAQALGETGFAAGETVEVTSVRGLTLTVRRNPEEKAKRGGTG
jgi:membrane-bound serine protease (ClpP class)